jgi:hypothetical protein
LYPPPGAGDRSPHGYPQRRSRPSPATILAASVSRPPQPPARERLRPPTPVPEAVAAGQHDALAAAPVRAGEHHPFPSLHTSLSHAASVTSVARHITAHPPEVERGCTLCEPELQVHEPCTRSQTFRVGRGGTPDGVEGTASGADRNQAPDTAPCAIARIAGPTLVTPLSPCDRGSLVLSSAGILREGASAFRRQLLALRPLDDFPDPETLLCH